MQRLGVTVLLTLAMVGCDSSESTTPPEPTPTDAVVEPQPELESEPVSEPEPETTAEAEPEVMAFEEPVFSQDGFEARNLECKFNSATRSAAAGYIKAGLVDVDAAIDACAPKGAVIDVTWGYISNQAQNISVSAQSNTVAKCVMKAMGGVRAGVEANCSAVLLIGDVTAATAAFDARK
jgi:hypothetical protein